MTQEQLLTLYGYALYVRRALHKIPEIGFELPKTVAFIASELRKHNISFTDRYGKCSLVAELGQGEKVIALRADIDGLPMEEKTGLPFSSEIAGQMHACGHDAHGAILLAVAKYLKEQEEQLPCRVRLIFQPSEEGAVSGAAMLVQNGVMEGVDHILCTHCENTLETGLIGVRSGDYMAACVPGTVCFYGKASHAAAPQAGIDAVAMAVEAYSRMKEMVRKEAGERPYIWNVGHITGGTVHNVVPDQCRMDISFRFYDKEFAERVESGVRGICGEIAERFGGRAEITWKMSTAAIHNDEVLATEFAEKVKAAGMDVKEMPGKMSSEDFAWYLEKAPGLIFRFGTRNEALGCSGPAHRSDFKIDEEGMKAAIKAFCTYILAGGQEL